MPERGRRDPVDWGIAARCRRGETRNGDLAVVMLLADGALVAGIDGLGHGTEAARAAGRAARVVRETPTADLAALVCRCHAALRGTRGAAISLGFLSHVTPALTWLGVGNVEGRVLSAQPASMTPKESLALDPGVLGHELPTLRPTTLPVQSGDVLVIATDGISSAFADSLDVSGSAQTICERVLALHWRPPDDAAVAAVRYLGARR